MNTDAQTVTLNGNKNKFVELPQRQIPLVCLGSPFVLKIAFYNHSGGFLEMHHGICRTLGTIINVSEGKVKRKHRNRKDNRTDGDRL